MATGPTDIAQFGSGGTLASAATVNVGTQTIGGLIFGATTTSGYGTLSNTAASTLTIGGSGITMNPSASHERRQRESRAGARCSRGQTIPPAF